MVKRELQALLLSLAGVELDRARDDLNNILDIERSEEVFRQMQQVMLAAEYIFASKTQQYGLFTDNRDADPAMGFFEQFADLNRKYTRLRHFARAKIAGDLRDGKPIPFKEVLDTCFDLTIYAMMMTVLAHRYSEKFDEPTGSCPSTGDEDWSGRINQHDPDRRR